MGTQWKTGNTDLQAPFSGYSAPCPRRVSEVDDSCVLNMVKLSPREVPPRAYSQPERVGNWFCSRYPACSFPRPLPGFLSAELAPPLSL